MTTPLTEENLVFETVQSVPYSSFECFFCSFRNSLLYFISYSSSKKLFVYGFFASGYNTTRI